MEKTTVQGTRVQGTNPSRWRRSAMMTFSAIERDVKLNRSIVRALFDEWDIPFVWVGGACLVEPDVYAGVRPRLVEHRRKRIAREVELTAR